MPVTDIVRKNDHRRVFVTPGQAMVTHLPPHIWESAIVCITSDHDVELRLGTERRVSLRGGESLTLDNVTVGSIIVQARERRAEVNMIINHDYVPSAVEQLAALARKHGK